MLSAPHKEMKAEHITAFARMIWNNRIPQF